MYVPRWHLLVLLVLMHLTLNVATLTQLVTHIHHGCIHCFSATYLVWTPVRSPRTTFSWQLSFINQQQRQHLWSYVCLHCLTTNNLSCLRNACCNVPTLPCCAKLALNLHCSVVHVSCLCSQPSARTAQANKTMLDQTQFAAGQHKYFTKKHKKRIGEKYQEMAFHSGSSTLYTQRESKQRKRMCRWLFHTHPRAHKHRYTKTKKHLLTKTNKFAKIWCVANTIMCIMTSIYARIAT